jgi:hypothetical protein
MRDEQWVRVRRLIHAHLLIALGILAMAGCQGVGPVEPTLVVLPTMTASPSPTRGPEITMPSPTLPPTWTPLPTIPPRPTAPLLPSYTAPPPTATLDLTAAVPVAVTSHARGVLELRLTEAQINAELARHFDAAPLPKYTSAPRVSLGDGAMTLTMHIVPINAPANAGPQTVILTVTWPINGDRPEVFPIQLTPWDSGITTRQVKLGHILLQQTLLDLVNERAGSPRTLTYNYVNISRDGIALTIVTQP